MKLISLEDFQNMAGLSDGAVLWLLRRKPEIFSLATGQLEIDADATDLQDILAAMVSKERAALDEQKRLIAERFARVITNHLDSIFSEVEASLAQPAPPSAVTNKSRHLANRGTITPEPCEGGFPRNTNDVGEKK